MLMSHPVTITTRPLASVEERLAAVRLYREVFGLPETDPAITPKLLAALQRNGGSAVGAFDDSERLVGFTYGFVGLDDQVVYHHSQAAVVDPRLHGRGVGRELKRAQGRMALATGVERMRWAYDPMQARNAHFNLDVLGARGRWFHRDYYGMSQDAGPSDRVVVEWPLREPTPLREPVQGRDAEPALPSPPPAWGATTRDGGHVWLAIPANWSNLVRLDPDHAASLRHRVAGHLERLLAGGRALVSCRRTDEDTAVYRIEEERR